MDETQVNPAAADDTTLVVESSEEVVVAPEAIEGEVVVEAQEAPASEEAVA